jgi:hypothetical protein
MSSPPVSQTDKPTEDEPEQDSPASSLPATIVSIEEQDDTQSGGMSLLTSGCSVTGNEAQDDRKPVPEDAIVQSTEVPYDAPIPLVAPLPPPDQEVSTPTQTSASEEKTPIQRYTRPELIRMGRAPESSLGQWLYVPLSMTHSTARVPSAMAHRAHTPSPEIANERARTPTPDQTAVLFDKNPSHGMSTYSSEPPELMELNPEDYEDSKILEFAWERPMAPNWRIDVNCPPRQGDTWSTAVAIQKGK